MELDIKKSESRMGDSKYRYGKRFSEYILLLVVRFFGRSRSTFRDQVRDPPGFTVTSDSESEITVPLQSLNSGSSHLYPPIESEEKIISDLPSSSLTNFRLE